MPQSVFNALGWSTWKVPEGVKNVKVTLNGAGSGSNRGGQVVGNLPVDDRWTLYLFNGQAGGLNSGASGGRATQGGGAAGGNAQGGAGGDSGGGASFIRVNSRTGTVKAVAGGAGGDSGDGGRGGPGGGLTGGSGSRGTTGTNDTEVSTGGTQSQGGNGGTSSAGSGFFGRNASDAVLATGGAGGQTAAGVPSDGGGGGGGGYRAGGGGQASSFGSKVLEATNQLPSPWDSGAVNSTPSKFTYDYSGTRIQATNQALNPNLQGGTVNGWNSNNPAMYPAVLDTTGAMSGTNSVRSDRLSANLDSTAASLYLTTPTGTQIPVTAGQPVTVSVDVKCELANRKIDMYWLWYDAGGASLPSTSHSYSVPDTGAANTTWRAWVTGIPPAGAVSAYLILTALTVSGGFATAGERVWFDSLRRSTGPGTLNATNLFPNPGVESGSATYWQSNNTGLFPVSADATAPISGKFSAMTTRTATSPSRFPGSISLTGASTAGCIPCTPGTRLYTACDVKAELAGRRVEIYYQWFNAAGSYTGTGARGTYTTLSAGQAVRAKYSEIPPAGAVLCQPVVEVSTVNSSLVSAGERCWFDNAAVGASDLPAFSGYTAPDGTYVYRWTGAAWGSPSERWKVSDAQQTDITYFDGGTVGTAQVGYNWSGAANASTSNRSYTGTTTFKVIAADAALPASDRRQAVQVTNTGGNGQLGVVTNASNVPVAVTAGSPVTFSAWVRISPDFPVASGGIQAILRDGPNADSNAATFDARGKNRDITPGVWTRLDWTATVNAGRTVTQIYIEAYGSGSPALLPVGSYLQTTAWMVNKTAALLNYFDGNTTDDAAYDYSWSGTVAASTSYKHHQTTPYAPGGGGGGGSSFTGGIGGASDTQGGGSAGNGSILITWSTPPPANLPPTPPSAVKINGVDATGGMLTKATSSVRVTATVNDPNADTVRLIARWSTSPTFTSYREVSSGLVKRNTAVTLTLNRLSQNTHYYVRLYARDQHNLWSTGYNGADFWTNKAPSASINSVNAQGSGMTLPSISSATFSWTHQDPDVADYQTGFRIRYRVAATSTAAASAWTEVKQYIGQNGSKVPGPPTTSVNTWVFDPNTFKGNRFYEWSVVTRDSQGLWGTESLLFSFWVSSVTSSPILLTPKGSSPVDVGAPATFTWRFLDPDPTKHQFNADLRYRVIGNTTAIGDGDSPTAGQWVTIFGQAGTATSLTVPADSFQPGFTYEWEVRTYNSSGGPASDWSDPFAFYAIGTPGSDAAPFPLPDNAKAQGSLGCGEYRVFIYQQGGQKRIGEVEPASKLTFTRVRDDISTCTVTSNGYSVDCGQLYGQVRSWMHELVVYRDGVRVWEGPITLITYTQTTVTFEAKDVMAYVYRRVMREGYDDAYRLIKKGTGGAPDQHLGLLSVVTRAQMLIVQALAPYDPNVLRYLTALPNDDDAQESRVVKSWSRTVWEEVDDLAATAGLDYTTVGRRIILWDTHHSIGRLPELRDGDFSDSPIVTEYGMQLATFFAVSNGSGVAGFTEVAAKAKPYGPIELLASSYSETDSASAEVQTPEALEKAEAALAEQAKRNISNRWPTPLVVRIPDNSTLSPNANVGFQQLIPGVWIPLRSVNTPRPVLQWQKLDSISVEVDDKGEKVHVVLSPAPHGGQDPDSEAAEDVAN
jgi:hypothetical protein